MNDDELSPALGGSRAQAEPAPPAPEPPRAADAGGGEGAPEIPPELAALLGPLGRLAEIFSEAGGPTVRVTASGGNDALSRGLDAFMDGAMREVTRRLPTTLAAFEGLVDAVEQAITPMLDELQESLRQAADRPEGVPETGEVVQRIEIVDAVEPEIPPVDLPPNP